TMAGAAALVRQYFVDGFYPGGKRNAANARTPSAALMKATLIAAARPVLLRRDILTNKTIAALPVPSPEQGWGFPVLDDALYFDADTRKMRVVDVPLANGLAEGESSTIRIRARPGTPLRAVLVWTDPPGRVRNSVADTTPQLVNDLDLHVNAITSGDRINNVEVVKVEDPSGIYEITVRAHRLGFGPRQSYALVITGDLEDASVRRRAARH
ncbi:MAG: hypothetical protein ACXWH7_14840, partial [Thermoanaerobaculia bacterium]